MVFTAFPLLPQAPNTNALETTSKLNPLPALQNYVPYSGPARITTVFIAFPLPPKAPKTNALKTTAKSNPPADFQNGLP